MSCIYRIINIKNNKSYVGSSLNPKRREYQHFWALRNNKHPNIHLNRACKKYGVESFMFEVLEDNVDVDEIIQREQFYINALKPEYNKRKIADSNLGVKHTPLSNITKERMSRSHRSLSDVDVLRLIELKNSGCKYKELAIMFNISEDSISKIVNGRVYKDIVNTKKDVNKNIRKKLTKEQVLDIYNKIKSGISQYKIAEQYGVNQSVVSRIKNKNENYKWLDVK